MDWDNASHMVLFKECGNDRVQWLLVINLHSLTNTVAMLGKWLVRVLNIYIYIYFFGPTESGENNYHYTKSRIYFHKGKRVYIKLEYIDLIFIIVYIWNKYKYLPPLRFLRKVCSWQIYVCQVLAKPWCN